MNFRKYLSESQEDLTPEEDLYDIENQESFNLEDIQSIIPELSDDEIHQLGVFIMELIYTPEFDDESDDESDDEFDDKFDEITEKKFFKTKKRQIKLNKKINKQQKRIDAKKRKIFYKRNKFKMKRAVYISKRRALINPSKVRTHIGK